MVGSTELKHTVTCMALVVILETVLVTQGSIQADPLLQAPGTKNEPKICKTHS